MLIFLGVFLLCAAVCLVEIPYLKKVNSQREKRIFWSLFTVSILIVSLKYGGVEIPNPGDGIAFLLKPFSDFLFSLLK
ncbi:hypothetical protein P4605_13155 [Priestia aryabhattai]|uniref:hypothetical protein n=1 Tax=Priestia aryabhattai TaxID=412384 RepID=UPI000BF1914A|nr:hypothetical protein [Priestia aryabhattai]MED3958272.1 hypothetical protein [Priestia aryabhattai]MED3988418.1 hypothetical protein [Priestia aryabhattai]PEI55646.1 hypothetical protein CN635_17380 [Priestia aryabhattai]